MQHVSVCDCLFAECSNNKRLLFITNERDTSKQRISVNCEWRVSAELIRHMKHIYINGNVFFVLFLNRVFPQSLCVSVNVLRYMQNGTYWQSKILGDWGWLFALLKQTNIYVISVEWVNFTIVRLHVWVYIYGDVTVHSMCDGVGSWFAEKPEMLNIQWGHTHTHPCIEYTYVRSFLVYIRWTHKMPTYNGNA